MIQLFYYSGIYFFILFVQYFINYLFSKEKDISIIKKNLLPAVTASLVIGSILHLLYTNFESFNSDILFYIFLSVTLYGYWFIINPLQNTLLSKQHQRNLEIENKLKKEGLNFKVFFTDEISTNAIATGIIPFYKIIILANNLKTSLNEKELMAIVYHEIGHHKRKHILIMYFLNVIFLTIYLIGRASMDNFEFPNKFYEGISVFCSGALFGLVVYYIPNKIMYFLEYDADSFSSKKYNRENIISALKSLDILSEGKLTEGNINHPNLEKRIANLENLNTD